MSGFTSVKLQRDETQLVIRVVPALICPYCGEAYVSERVAAQLLRHAEMMSQQGILEGGIEYNGYE